ncbi:DUF262 domain-containing protein [Archangium gephyra]|uniref:DUF262 domain-containing protein n=1 Tax=Archangium gephyra TaxID=48 RepID=UPI003B7E34EF
MNSTTNSHQKNNSFKRPSSTSNFYIELRIKDAVENWPTKKSDKTPKTASVLKGIRDKILGLKLITIDLDNEDDAYIIFETLNTRGKDLQVSHLVKNHFSRLLKANNKSIDIVKHSWEQLHETFETSQVDLDVDSFLHHFWLSREDYVTEKRLFTLMKKSITKDNAKSNLDDMLSDAKLYRTIGEPGYRKWRNDETHLKSTLEALSIFRVRQPFPLVLSILRAYQKRQISKKNAEAVLWAIECFHFTFTAIASKSSSGGLSMMYASLAQKIFKASTESEWQKVLREARDKLKSRLPKRDDFIVEFKKLRYSDEFTKQKRLVKYVLARIDRHLSKSGVAVDYDKMTIEHVAPQNPSSPGAIPEDHVGMLGNLLLCDEKLQDKLKNKPFPDKKAVLTASGVAAKEIIVSKSVWDAAAVEERTQKLAELAYDQIWKI